MTPEITDSDLRDLAAISYRDARPPHEWRSVDHRLCTVRRVSASLAEVRLVGTDGEDLTLRPVRVRYSHEIMMRSTSTYRERAARGLR